MQVDDDKEGETNAKDNSGTERVVHSQVPPPMSAPSVALQSQSAANPVAPTLPIALRSRMAQDPPNSTITQPRLHDSTGRPLPRRLGPPVPPSQTERRSPSPTLPSPPPSGWVADDFMMHDFSELPDSSLPNSSEDNEPSALDVPLRDLSLTSIPANSSKVRRL